MKAPLPLREILEKALKMPVAGPGVVTPSYRDERLDPLFRLWSEFLGPRLAANSRPARISGQTLVIEVSSSVWANELEYVKCALMEKIRGLTVFENLKNVRFQIATRSASDKGLKTKPLKSFG